MKKYSIIDNNIMAVGKKNFSDTEGEITITNGDFQALLKIARDYGMNDESDVIAFALGVLSKANGGAVSVDQPDGSIAKFIPAEKLRTKS